MPAFLDRFGYFVPDRVVGNEEIAARVGKTAEWIETSSGIRERRWAEPGTTVADMAVLAAERCLPGAPPGMVIVASGSRARGFPGPAAEVAHRLGFGQIPALDVPMASAGSLFALDLARRYVEEVGSVLVIGAEKMSSLIGAHEGGPLDPNLAILFGDGAGAALVTAQTGRWKIVDAALHSDGQYRDDLKSDGSQLAMNGLSVILQASRKMPAAIEEVLTRQGMAAGQIGTLLLHQANLNLLTRVGKALGVEAAKVFTNVQRYGNTSSASLLIAAAEWAQSPAEGPVVMSAFGAGFHWGALLAVPVG